MQAQLPQFTDFPPPVLSLRNNQTLLSNQVFVFKYRRWLLNLQNKLKDEPQIKIKLYHKFFDDYYIRTAIIPEDTFLIGKTHAMSMLDTVLYGDITIMIDGQHIRMKPGDRFISQPGSKKAGYAHTKTAFTNVYQTKERDIKQIESETILTDEEEESYINTELKYLEAL